MKRLISALIISGVFAVPYSAAAGQNTQNPPPPIECSQNNPCEPAPIVCDMNSQNGCPSQNTAKKVGHWRHAVKFASR